MGTVRLSAGGGYEDVPSVDTNDNDTSFPGDDDDDEHGGDPLAPASSSPRSRGKRNGGGPTYAKIPRNDDDDLEDLEDNHHDSRRKSVALFAPVSPTRMHSYPLQNDEGGSTITRIMRYLLLFMVFLVILLVSIQKGWFPPRLPLHITHADDDEDNDDYSVPEVEKYSPQQTAKASSTSTAVHYDSSAPLRSYSPFDLDMSQAADWYGGTFVSPPYNMNSRGDDDDEGTLGYLTQPNLVNNTLVFVAEGDMYLSQLLLDTTSSMSAMKLTTTEGNVMSPTINPVYPYLIAYTATYTGHREVYLLDTRAHQRTTPALRLTYTDSPFGVLKVVGWKDDGETLVFSAPSKEVGFPDIRLYQISLAQEGVSDTTGDDKKTTSKNDNNDNDRRSLSHGPLRVMQVQPIPLTQAIDGVWNDDCLYFTRHAQSSSTFRYVGGTVESLWAYCHEQEEAVPLTWHNYNGTSKSPQIIKYDGRREYLLFLSDRLWSKGGWIPATMNLWALPLPKERDVYGKGSISDSNYVQLTSVSCDFDGMSLMEYALDSVTNDVVLRVGADFYRLSSNDIRKTLDDASKGVNNGGDRELAPSSKLERLPVVVYSDFQEQQERLLPVKIPGHLLSADVYHTAFGSTSVLMGLRGQLFVVPVIADTENHQPYAGAGMNMPPRRYRVVPGTSTGGIVRVLMAKYVPLYLDKTGRRLALVLATDPKSETAEHGFYLVETQSDSAPSFVDVKELPDPFLGGSLNGGSVRDGGLGSVDADSVVVSPCGRRLAWTDKDGRICVMTLPMYRDEPSYVVLPDQNEQGEPLLGTEADLIWSPGGRYLALAHLARNQFQIISIVDCGDPERDGPDAVADVQIGRIVQATPDRFNSIKPVWGKSPLDFKVAEQNELLGKLMGGAPSLSTDGATTLYFLSDRDIVSDTGSPWGSRRPDPNFPRRLSVYALPLVSDEDEKGPLTPSLGRFAGGGAGELWVNEILALEQTLEGMQAGGEQPSAAPSSLAAKAESPPKLSPFPKDRKIRFGDSSELGFARGAYRVGNIPEGTYTHLVCQALDDPSLVLIDREGLKIFSVGDFPSDTIEPMSVKFSGNALTNYDVSTTRGNLVFVFESELPMLPPKVIVVENSAKGLAAFIGDDKLAKNNLDIDKMALSIWPALEYQQMFDDAWRLLRDYFYDVNMHGVDWPAIHRRYRPLVKRCAKREDLDDILRQMAAEVSALHVFVYGGEYSTPLNGGDKALAEIHEIGSLGATFERTAEWKGYVVTSIAERDPDFNLVDARPVYSPLSDQSLRLTGQRGLQVGDVIVGVNGESVMRAPDIHMLLRGTAGRSVRLEVLRLVSSSDSSGRRRRHAAAEAPSVVPEPLIVVPISPSAAEALRYDAWEWKTRQRAKQLAADAGFTVGYVHLQSMNSPEDIDAFFRGFFPDYNKQALILDMRHNKGGNIDTWVLDILQRKPWDYFQGRVSNMTNGGLGWDEQFSFRGHLVVLIDEHTSSDGEGFSRGVSELKLGKLIGARTWGGGIWLASDNHLVDGGIASAPEIGTFTASSGFGWGSGVEMTGVEPDFFVDNNPRVFYDGKDQQLEFAVEYLKQWLKDEPVVLPKGPGPHDIRAVPPEAEEQCNARR